MRMRAVAAVLAGLALFAAPGATMPLLQIEHLQRLALSAAALPAFYAAYLAGLLLASLPVAALGGRIGAPRLFGLAVAALATSTFLLSLPLGLVPLVGLRLLQGMAAAALLVGSYALLRQLFGPERLALALACGVAAVTAGFVLLPVLSGFGMNFLGGFGVVLPVLALAVAALGLAFRTLPKPDAAPQPFDILGTLLAILCLGLLLASMNLSPYRPLTALVLLVLGLLVLGLWLWQQSRRPWPLLPLDLLARPVVGWAVPAAILCGLATTGSNIALMSQLPDGARENPALIGIVLLAGGVLSATLALVAGWCFARGPWHLAAILGAALIACGLAASAWWPSQATWVGAMIACAVGRSLFDVGNGVHVLGAAPRERALAAAGLIGFAGALGSELGPYVVTVLPLMLFGVAHDRDSLTIWLGISAVAALLALLFSLAAGRAASRAA